MESSKPGKKKALITDNATNKHTNSYYEENVGTQKAFFGSSHYNRKHVSCSKSVT
jgi:hypothetical protein